jgi:plasmid maintenance system antidote protein VapI
MSVGLPTHRPPTHPGEMLAEEFIIPLGLSLARDGAAAPHLVSPPA